MTDLRRASEKFMQIRVIVEVVQSVIVTIYYLNEHEITC